MIRQGLARATRKRRMPSLSVGVLDLPTSFPCIVRAVTADSVGGLQHKPSLCLSFAFKSLSTVPGESKMPTNETERTSTSPRLRPSDRRMFSSSNGDAAPEGRPPNRNRSGVSDHLALQKMDEMATFVDSLENQQNPPAATKLREALMYWLSISVRQVASRQGRLQYPIDMADTIVDYVLAQDDFDYLEQVIGSGGMTTIESEESEEDDLFWEPSPGSPNINLCRMIRFHSAPLQGRRGFLQGGNYLAQSYQHVQLSDKIDGLYKASKVAKILQSLHENPAAPSFTPDFESSKVIMTLWNRRLKLLNELSSRNSKDVDIVTNQDWQKDDRITFALGGAVTTTECLDQMRRLMTEDIRPRIDDAYSLGKFYNALLSAYPSLGREGAADEAYRTLMELEEDPAVQVPIDCYNAVLMCFAREANDANSHAMDSALELWKHMNDTFSKGEKARGHLVESSASFSDELSSLNPVTVSTVLKILDGSRQPQMAQDFLERIEGMADKEGANYPNLVHYNTCLTAWAKSKLPEGGRRAESLLLRMTDLSNVDMKASSRRSSISQSRRRDILPDQVSYTAVIEALLFSGQPDGIDRADSYLAACEASPDERQMPDTAMYVTFLRGLLVRHRREIESQLREAICERMDDILYRMLERSKDFKSVKKPISDTYSLVLNGWATSESSLAASRALTLLDSMESNRISPDERCFVFALKCLYIKPERKDKERIIQSAQSLIKKMDDLNISKTILVFNEYLSLLGRFGFVEEAETILRNAESAFLNGTGEILPDEASYFALVDGYSTSHASDAERILREYCDKIPGKDPPQHMYAKVIGAWGRSGRPEALGRVEALFDEVKRITDDQVTGYVYGSYITALRLADRRADTPHRIEEILQKMYSDFETGRNISGQPNATNFATAITCWAKSGQRGAASRAEAILDRLEDLYSSGDHRHRKLKPTMACYRGVLNAWAWSEEPQCGDKAISILDRMERGTAMKPDRLCYTYAIKAVGRSDDPEKANKAFSILERMRRAYEDGVRHAEPQSDHFVNAIRAIGSLTGTKEHRETAFELTQRALSDYQSFKPSKRNKRDMDDEAVYLQFLWAANKLLPASDSRHEAIKKSLRSCPSRILRSRSMKEALYKILPRDVCDDMLREAGTSTA